MAELIQETKDFIAALGYTKDDIQWIGGQDFVVPLDCFWNAAPQFYDAGYGWAEVAEDFKIVFKDGSWMERAEYDGSEWWNYKCCPKRPLRIVPVNNFISHHYESTLARINNVTN